MRNAAPAISKITVFLLAAALVALLMTALFVKPAEAQTVAADPNALDFGKVAVGNGKTLDVKVTNNGSDPVTIPVDAVSGNGFKTSLTLPKTVEPGKTVKVPVTFKPTVEGPSTGSLALVDAGHTPVLTIPLTGTGTKKKHHRHHHH
jgi:uncharacterized protein (DUF58 family)